MRNCYVIRHKLGGITQSNIIYLLKFLSFQIGQIKRSYCDTYRLDVRLSTFNCIVIYTTLDHIAVNILSESMFIFLNKGCNSILETKKSLLYDKVS